MQTSENIQNHGPFMAPADCTGCQPELTPQLFTPMAGVLRLCQIAAGENQNRDEAMESRGSSAAVQGSTE